jgi:hypothetical protein
MMPFEYFLQNKEVKTASPDMNLAKSLVKDMFERIEKSLMLDSKIFAKMIFENIYDALRDFCDALLAINGYKSYSHQASISYLAKEGFDVSIIEQLDQFRYKRNGSKYYGQQIFFEDAEQIRDFYLKNKSKFERIINKKGLKEKRVR